MKVNMDNPIKYIMQSNMEDNEYKKDNKLNEMLKKLIIKKDIKRLIKKNNVIPYLHNERIYWIKG